MSLRDLQTLCAGFRGVATSRVAADSLVSTALTLLDAAIRPGAAALPSGPAFIRSAAAPGSAPLLTYAMGATAG